MRVLDTISRNPVAGLAVVIAGIGGWIAAEFLNPAPPCPVASSGPVPVRATMTRILPPPPTTDQTVSLAVLPKLRLGMTRVEVETLIGTPPAEAVQPVTLTDGRFRYRAAYDLGEPDPPATIRPIRRFHVPPPPPEPQARVALEFDASQPGHPLVEIVYLDPLF